MWKAPRHFLGHFNMVIGVQAFQEKSEPNYDILHTSLKLDTPLKLIDWIYEWYISNNFVYSCIGTCIYLSLSPYLPPNMSPQGYCLFQTNRDFLSPPQDAPEVDSVTWPPGRSPGTCQECLVEMGFCDRKLNEQLLKKHNNNVALVVNELLSFTDNDWSTRRH